MKNPKFSANLKKFEKKDYVEKTMSHDIELSKHMQASGVENYSAVMHSWAPLTENLVGEKRKLKFSASKWINATV